MHKPGSGCEYNKIKPSIRVPTRMLPIESTMVYRYELKQQDQSKLDRNEMEGKRHNNAIA